PGLAPRAGNRTAGVAWGRGIACLLYEGNNGYSALVAEVEVDQDTGVIVVKRFVASGDSGPISNPDGFRNQMEGGALQGMSRALREEVKWTDNAIISTDWRRFPVFKFGDFRREVVTVRVNPREKQQRGAGEPPLTIVAAAMANAVFAAAGARLRQVPFTPGRVLEALKARG